MIPVKAPNKDAVKPELHRLLLEVRSVLHGHELGDCLEVLFSEICQIALQASPTLADFETTITAIQQAMLINGREHFGVKSN